MGLWSSIMDVLKNIVKPAPPPLGITQDNFDRSIAFTMSPDHEGGFVDDPKDPGGATKYGISLRFHPELGYDGIKNLTPDHAKMIYRAGYWIPSGAANMPWPLCLAVFDSSVNPGLGAVKRFVSATEGISGVKDRARAVVATRRAYYNDLVRRHPEKNHDIKGWLRRCADLDRIIDAS